MIKKSNIAICLFLMFGNGLLNAKTNLDTENKVSLEKKDVIYKYFNISDKSRNLYKLFKQNVLAGDYSQARKNAKKLFVNVNTLNNKNQIEVELANMALGEIDYLTDQKYKWRYMHLEAVNYFLSNKKSIGINDFVFGMIELNDILIEKFGVMKARQVILDINSIVKDNFNNFSEKDKQYIQIKTNENMAEINFKEKKLRQALYSLSVANKYTKRLYTYSSLQESHLLFKKAFYIYNLNFDTDLSLNILKSALKIADKILKEKNLDKNSVFLADINNFIGRILSSGTKQEEANLYLKRAISIYKNTNSHMKEVKTTFQLINSYKIINQLKLAEDYVKRLQNTVAEYFGKDSIEYADTLISEADILNTSENFKEAIAKMNEAKSIYIKKYGSYSKEVRMLNSTLNYIKSQQD